MTDWMPWGFVFMTGTLVTLGLALRALARTPAGTTPHLKPAWTSFLVTAALSLLVYALYLVLGEAWLPY